MAYRSVSNWRISIHALREEGDSWRQSGTSLWCYFYPRPPRGGRRKLEAIEAATNGFLSTPSARRATREVLDAVSD